tara:strand:+ start:648 stop:776 length:129 start_codon:yes stop_codon:yes gene_type:complete
MEVVADSDLASEMKEVVTTLVTLKSTNKLLNKASKAQLQCLF